MFSLYNYGNIIIKSKIFCIIEWIPHNRRRAKDTFVHTSIILLSAYPNSKGKNVLSEDNAEMPKETVSNKLSLKEP